MLWATEEPLRDNYFAALVQLKSLEKRLEKDVVLNEKYQKTIDDDLANGYIIEVPSYDPAKRTTREWCLPHHPIVNLHKPENVRRVLNGASKCQKQSLNNALFTGPDLLQTFYTFQSVSESFLSPYQQTLRYVSASRRPTGRQTISQTFVAGGPHQ